jgi:hypothetical protein
MVLFVLSAALSLPGLDGGIPVRFAPSTTAEGGGRSGGHRHAQAGPMSEVPTATARPAPGRNSYRPTARGLPLPVLGLLAALAWWPLGFAPWVLSVVRHGGSGGAEALGLPVGVRLAVPLLSTSLAELVFHALIGGVVAGLLGLLGRGRRRFAALTALLGVCVALVLVVAQTVLTVHDSPGAFAADPRVVAGLVVVLVLAALGGWAIGSCALLGLPGLGLALAVVAGVLPGWLSGVEAALRPGGSASALGSAAQWAGAALLAGALAMVGLRPPVRALWWPVLVLVAWWTGPVSTAAVYLSALLRPGAGLPATLPESVRAAQQVLGEAGSLDVRPLTTWVVAVLAAFTVASVGALVARRNPPPTLIR